MRFKFLQLTLLLVLLIYGLAINSYLAVYLTCEDCVPLVAQLNHIAHWITLSSLLIFPLVVFIPYKKYAGLWLLPGVIAFLGWYGGLFLPGTRPVTADQNSFRVMTYNVLGALSDPEQTFAVVTQHNPDILGIHELRRANLDDKLKAAYPYHVSQIGDDYGTGLYSRYPILDSTIYIPPTYTEWHDPTHLRAVLDIDGQRVAVYVFHPAIPAFHLWQFYDDQYSEQNYQFITSLLDRETLPMLVLCDCNTTPRTHQYRQMAARLNDAFKVRGWGFGLTHPGDPRLNFATIRIDYLWYSDHFTPLEVQVGAERGTSDHWPVWGQFTYHATRP